MRVVSAMILFAALVLTSGCQAPPQPAGPTGLIMHIPDREEFFDHTLTILREMDFTPLRVDREHGVIETHPTTSGQWFEFWRSDSQGLYQAFESSIHTVRRTLHVDIAPHDTNDEAEAPAYRISIEAQKQRYSGVERQITTTSGGLALYSAEVPTVEGRVGRSAAREAWTPQGRDALLESYVLDRIVRANPQARYLGELPPAPPGEGQESPAGAQASATGTWSRRPHEGRDDPRQVE